MSKKKEIFILSFLIFLFLVINYSSLDRAVQNFLIEENFAKVERVIDGDTIVINGNSIRLLGINAPEKGEPYSQEAKTFLESLVLNKTIKVEDHGKDLYNRTLAYLFYGNQNINLELVKKGLANFYFPTYNKDVYFSQFQNAWNNCNINLCEKSSDICADCINLKKYYVKNQEVIFHNKCSFSCDLSEWQIKDEGRKKFIFPQFILGAQKDVLIIVGQGENNQEKLFWKNQNYVWTESGDTLFLRDANSKLILFENYE